MNKRQFFTILALVLILIGTVAYTTSSEANTTPIIMDAKYPNVEVLNKTNPESETSIEYPFFHNKEIDQIISSYIKKWQDQPVTVTYSIVHYSQQTVSIQFKAQSSIHTNDKTTYALNIDLTDETVIPIENLFSTDDTNAYLTILSDIAYNELKNKKGLPLSNKEIKEATAPTLEHFREFTLLNNAIVFYLNIGNQISDMQLAVSKDLLKDMLLNQYKTSETNKDIVEDYVPSDLITVLPENKVQIPLDQKVIALSFDDGPKKGTTDIILEALKNYDAHATFFVLGHMAEKNPELLTEIVNQGNEIGSHSWDHPQLTKLSNEEIQSQINRTNSLINDITGIEPTLLRPPYGAFNQRVNQYLGNMEVALWDIDPEDWKYRNKEHIVQSVMKQAGENRIILLHDIYQTSADAAVEIIHQLTSQGYKIVSVSELLEIQKHRELASQ